MNQAGIYKGTSLTTGASPFTLTASDTITIPLRAIKQGPFSITCNILVGEVSKQTLPSTLTSTFSPSDFTYSATLIGTLMELTIPAYSFNLTEATFVKVTIPSGFKSNRTQTGNVITLDTYTVGTGFTLTKFKMSTDKCFGSEFTHTYVVNAYNANNEVLASSTFALSNPFSSLPHFASLAISHSNFYTYAEGQLIV